MSTLAEYRSAVRAQGYEGKSDALVDEAINEARRGLETDHAWNHLEEQSTVLTAFASNPVVSLAPITDLAEIRGVRLRNGTTQYDLDGIPLQRLRDYQTDEATTSTGVPLYWARRGGELLLWPTPAVAYVAVVDYKQTTTDLTDPLVEDPTWPDRFRNVITWRAIVSLAFRERESWAMQYAQQRADGFYKSLVTNDTIQQTADSDQVQSRWAPRGY